MVQNNFDNKISFPGLSEMILGMCVGEMREGLIHPEMGFGVFVRWFCLNHLYKV